MGLMPEARARFMVADMAWSNRLPGAPDSPMDSATSTSPFGRTCMLRGWTRPRAKALTFSPGAAVGLWSPSQPFAVGIFRVGRMPWDFGSGMAGAVP